MKWLRSVLLLRVETELTSPSSFSLMDALRDIFLPPTPPPGLGLESSEEPLELDDTLDFSSSSSSRVDPRLLVEPPAVSPSVPSSAPFRALSFFCSFSLCFLSFLSRFSTVAVRITRLTLLFDDCLSEVNLFGAQLTEVLVFVFVLVFIMHGLVEAAVLRVRLDLTRVTLLDELILVIGTLSLFVAEGVRVIVGLSAWTKLAPPSTLSADSASVVRPRI